MGAKTRGIYRWVVILPMLLIMYMTAYIDRTNISFAMSGIQESFSTGAAIAGLISGIFFVGYTILQAPGGHIASTRSARKNVLVFGILTGVFNSIQGLSINIEMFLVVRFFLGVAEGVMLPTMFVLINNWFAEEERGRATNTFMLYQCFGPILMSPLCGFIVAYLHLGNFESWRWMFLFEGMLPVIMAIVFYIVVRDHPTQQPTLKADELSYLLESQRKEAKKPKLSQETTPSTKAYIRAALKPTFLLVMFSWFLMVVGNYGTSMWLPEVIRDLTEIGFAEVGFISAIPWICCAVAMVVVGWINDKWGNKRMLLIICESVAGVSLLLSAFAGAGGNPILAIILLIISMMASTSASPTYLTTLPRFVAPVLIGGLTGIFSAIGNLGGFFGPIGVGALVDMNNGNMMAGLQFLGVVYLVSGALMLFANLREEKKKQG